MAATNKQITKKKKAQQIRPIPIPTTMVANDIGHREDPGFLSHAVSFASSLYGKGAASLQWKKTSEAEATVRNWEKILHQFAIIRDKLADQEEIEGQRIWAMSPLQQEALVRYWETVAADFKVPTAVEPS